MDMIRSFFDNPIFLFRIPAIIIALSFHELAHALAAYKLGDRSQEQRGRLTLNPLKHIDPIGILMLLLVGFGWAKPVMVDPRAFRNVKRGMGITAFAGPLTNFILAFFSALALVVVFHVTFANFLTFVDVPYHMNFASLVEINGIQAVLTAFMNYLLSGTAGATGTFLIFLLLINIGLGLFNLLPIPPLDGSKVLGAFMPNDLYNRYMRVQQFGMIILIVLLFSGALDFLGEAIFWVAIRFMLFAEMLVTPIMGLFI
ncbi:MAG: site-2 protease family protein [Oscillospiraceae bacterium]|nr:site-2 protease family protein [Oscillospiraceae bacterium]